MTKFLNESKEFFISMLSEDQGAWALMNYLKTNKIKIKDREVAQLALEKNGQILNYCSDSLKDSDYLVKIAVTNNGMALDYASQRLKDNDDIVKIAMKLNQAILFASKRIKESKEFALLSLRYNPNDIRFYSNEIKNICGTGRLQKERLEKAIADEKFANNLSDKLEEKSQSK